MGRAGGGPQDAGGRARMEMVRALACMLACLHVRLLACVLACVWWGRLVHEGHVTCCGALLLLFGDASAWLRL